MIKIFLSIVLFLVGTGIANAGEFLYLDGHAPATLYIKSDMDSSTGTTQYSVNACGGGMLSYSGTEITYQKDCTLWKKNVGDTGDGVQLLTGTVYTSKFSPDGAYIYYENGSDGNRIYKKSANDTSPGTAITTDTAGIGFDLSYDGQYIAYSNSSHGYKMYIKFANDSNNGVESTSDVAYQLNFSPSGYDIVYRNGSNGNRLYIKSVSDAYNGTAVTSDGDEGQPTYSPDGLYIIYSNSSQGNRIFKKSASDTNNGTGITLEGAGYPNYARGEYTPPEPYCHTPEPTGGHYGALTYNPETLDQAWIYDAFGSGSCSYKCTGGYSGTGCTTDPVPYNPPVSGHCGTAVGTYGYTATAFVGTLCSVGTADPSTPTFPTYGSGVSWDCVGYYSGATVSCSATRQAHPFTCATPVPTGGNYGALTYSPESVNQSWVYTPIGSHCSYQCINGYTGSGCTTAPVSETGSTTDTGFWGSLLNPFTTFFTDALAWMNNFLSFPTRVEPYGITFSGGETPLSIGVGAQVACGVVNTWHTGTSCWTTGIFEGHTSVSGKYWNWERHYYYTPYLTCSAAGDVAEYGSGNIEHIVVDGQFTYLKDNRGQDITVTNIITIAQNWGITVNTQYDVVLFGFSMVDLVNSFLEVIVGGIRYVIQYMVFVSKNILDLISMFFYEYQAPGQNACFFGEFHKLPTQITETAITHTQNNGLLDLLFYCLYSYGLYRLIKRKIG